MVKYSGADRALFSLKGEKNSLMMLIKDNGKGFDIDAAEKQQTGMGLQNIRSRIGLLTAALEINSVIDEGSIYHITVPVTAKLNGN